MAWHFPRWLAGQGETELRHFAGKATFGNCFRRPLFAVFESVLVEIQERAENQVKAVPRPESWYEAAMMVALTHEVHQPESEDRSRGFSGAF